MRKGKANNKLIFIIRIIILCAFLAILFKIVDFKIVLIYIKEIPWQIFVFLIILGFIRALFNGLRWRLLNPDVTGQLSLWQYFRFTVASKIFNLTMPGSLGGDFARTIMTLRVLNGKKIDNVIAIVMDRFIGLLSILIIGTLAFILISDIPDPTAFYFFFIVIYLIAIVVSLIFTSAAMLNFFEKHMHRLGSIGSLLINVVKTWRTALHYFKHNKKKVLLWLFLCLPIHLISFFSAYILARTLNIGVYFLDICLVMSVVWLVTAIPITISGAGVRELSFIYLLSIYDVTAESATALLACIYIVGLFLGLIGMVLIVDWKKWFCSFIIRLKGGKYENM